MKCKAMLDARPRMRLDILDCLYLSAPHPDDVVAAFAKGPDMDMMPRLVLAIKLGVGCIEPTGFTVPDAFIRASLQSVFCKQDALPFLK